MELNNDILDTPPLDSASVVMLRDGPGGLEVLLMQRNIRSDVLGGAYVFPGGKVDAADAEDATLALLDRSTAELHARLGEPELPAARAGAMFIAAAREAAEESGVLYLQVGPDEIARHSSSTCQRLRAGESFATLLGEHKALLDTDALVPWSRWITPRQASFMKKRFDTRFFLAAVPEQQEACQDDHEMTETRWLTPRTALAQYRDHEIDMAPPQIVSLMHLMLFDTVAAALADGRSRTPPLIEPGQAQGDAERILCYPGDPDHPVRERAFPNCTRLEWRDKRFQPPGGLDALLR